MIIKNTQQLKKYQEAGKLSAKILGQLRQAVKKGVTPLEVDQLADELCAQHQVKPCFKGVGPRDNAYKYATCIAVNDTVVHGIPDDRPFEDGDVVKVDFGINYQGLNTDHCFTVGVGEVSAEDVNLIKTAKKAIQKAAHKAVVGKTTGDLGHIMEKESLKQGFNVAKEFVGHGIGHSLHENPQIPAYGKPGSGSVLKRGMVLCVEAQIIAGRDDIFVERDGWTVKTVDGSKVAMFEYMVVVQPKKPLFLTPTLDWPILNE